MREKLFMAVDLGTSFIKTGVYSLDGVLLSGWSEPVKAERPAQGIFIQRGQSLYSAVCACIKRTTKALGDDVSSVAAVAFTGQMAGAMGVDENWNDITTWSCSLDGRYLPYAEKQREKYGRDLFAIGGTNAPVMCAKYDWFRNEFPEEHGKIAKYVMLNSYIIGRLSKIPIDEAKIDDSLITWTGLADIRSRGWSEKLCREMGIDQAVLPQVAGCTEIGGTLHPDVAKELGLPPGLPLVLGAGDKVSGCVGAGILDEGEMIFEAASYGAVSCKVREVHLDHKRRNYDVIGAADPDGFYVHKYIQGSGITTDWFVNTFMREEGEEQKEAFRRAETLCEGIGPGSNKLLAIGLLGGSAMPFDNEMKGLFMGHTWSHHRGHFYHALLESFSYDLALTLESITSLYPQCANSPLKLIGGGAKSAVWPQMLADITGRIFECLDRKDAALWGTALLAAAGVGAVSDIRAAAKEKAAAVTVYRPEGAAHRAYEPYIRFYDTLSVQMHDLYRQLNQI